MQTSLAGLQGSLCLIYGAGNQAASAHCSESTFAHCLECVSLESLLLYNTLYPSAAVAFLVEVWLQAY